MYHIMSPIHFLICFTFSLTSLNRAFCPLESTFLVVFIKFYSWLLCWNVVWQSWNSWLFLCFLPRTYISHCKGLEGSVKPWLAEVLYLASEYLWGEGTSTGWDSWAPTPPNWEGMSLFAGWLLSSALIIWYNKLWVVIKDKWLWRELWMMLLEDGFKTLKLLWKIIPTSWS